VGGQGGRGNAPSALAGVGSTAGGGAGGFSDSLAGGWMAGGGGLVGGAAVVGSTISVVTGPRTIFKVRGGLKMPDFIDKPPDAAAAAAVASAAGKASEGLKAGADVGSCDVTPHVLLPVSARCQHNGILYECFAVPGHSVEQETDAAPDSNCLSGKESWGTCDHGQFLCKARPPLPPSTFHTIYSVQSSRYFEWQVRYHQYFFKKSRQEGHYTRLLSCSTKDHLVAEIDTWVSPQYPKLNSDAYVPYNKPFAISHWLRHSGVRAEYIIIVDPDCIFLRPLAKQGHGGGVVVSLANGKTVEVSKGKPFGQKGYMDWIKGGPFESLTRKYCASCKMPVDALAVPLHLYLYICI
jgi:hypothetical protein